MEAKGGARRVETKTARVKRTIQNPAGRGSVEPGKLAEVMRRIVLEHAGEPRDNAAYLKYVDRPSVVVIGRQSRPGGAKGRRGRMRVVKKRAVIKKK